MQIIEVTNRDLERHFIQVNVRLYRDDPNYIRPLDRDVQEVFDSSRNRLFLTGAAKRWVLQDVGGTYIGRIAAFYNPRYKNAGDTVKAGGIGFFDCINDQAAADLLFRTAADWLREMGAEAMDGPINFGERDKFWGLLVDGFHPPLYGMNYNAPYYQELFERHGFRVFYNQLCWHLDVDRRLPDRFYQTHEKFVSNPDIRAEHIDTRRLEKYACDFSTIYNKAWAKHQGNKEISPEKAIGIFRKLRHVIDEDIVWYAYHRDEPVAIWMNIPDLNQIFRHFNGSLTTWRKLQLLWYRHMGACTRFVGIIYGIVPEWQGTGIDYYMIVEAAKVIQSKRKYRELELQWQGDFNPKMIAISKHLGGSLSRKLATYRLIFDPAKEFRRHPILN
ncbi:MAG TPA: hypothetical protein VFZ78_10395 [Flavisolibacter sp.]